MQIKVQGNFLEFYDPTTDSLGGDCPLKYDNAKLIFIDEDEAVFEVEKGLSRIVRVNGIGDVEEVIFPEE